MINDAINVAMVYGSTRDGRLCDTVAIWTGEQVWRRRRFMLDIIDPATLPAPDWLQPNPGLDCVTRRLERADGFLIVTPEYNHGYPASLKFLIDSTGRAWRTKPVAFVSYGGASGGLRAVEQLRQVFAELHCVSVRDSVSFANAGSRFDADGALRDAEAAEESMSTMLAQLHWWAVALRDARVLQPFENLAA